MPLHTERPLGLFGGTFDPVHFGHLRLAEAAIDTLGLAAVHWIPVGQPGHRPAPCVSAAHRLAMLHLAVDDNPRFVIDDSEIRQSNTSYTVPTLLRIRQQYGEKQALVFLLGADAFAGLTTWHRWHELFKLTHLALVARPGHHLDTASLPQALRQCLAERQIFDPQQLSRSPAGQLIFLDSTALAISATAIREQILQQQSPRYLLPDALIDYINHHKLYQYHHGH